MEVMKLAQFTTFLDSIKAKYEVEGRGTFTTMVKVYGADEVSYIRFAFDTLGECFRIW